MDVQFILHPFSYNKVSLTLYTYYEWVRGSRLCINVLSSEVSFGALLSNSGAIIHKLVFCVHYMNCINYCVTERVAKSQNRLSFCAWLSSCLLSPTMTTIAFCSRRRISGLALAAVAHRKPNCVPHPPLLATINSAGKRALFQVIALWHEIRSHGLFVCLWPFN